MRIGRIVLGALLATACQANAAPTPSASEGSAEPTPALLEPGATLEMPALDADGEWGTVTLRRGDETGGYPTDEIDPDTFIIELVVEYAADRQPVGDFGRDDWVLATADDMRPIGNLFEPAPPLDPQAMEADRWPLGTFPGAMEVSGSILRGTLYLQVPRENADEPLALVYRPRGTDTVAPIRLREPGHAPAPVPTATPVPTPAPVTYVDRAGLPFSVIDDADADALFADPETCTNPVAGYTVTYPDSWYTNTAIGDTPACSWFAPTDYQVTGTELPDEVVIVVRVFDGAIGFFNAPDYSLNEQVPIDGFTGSRHEQVGVRHEGGAYQPLPPSYAYTAIVGDGPVEGPTMIASTGGDGAPDYELNKAVLDRIMASIRFDR